jgi:hypothetical protein
VGILGIGRVPIQPVQRRGEGVNGWHSFAEVSTAGKARSM